jgi:release factor glutamine methyltransferase
MDVWNLTKIADRLEQLDIAIDREAMSLARWIWSEILEFGSTQSHSISIQAQERLDKVFERLQLGEPVQYIAGHAWFYGLKFKVNQDVLIPRPETEELVEWILSDVKLMDFNKVRILDIGTGSGCIAVVLKKHLGERADITAMDISTGALQVASDNSRTMEAEINFCRRDFLLEGIEGLGQFDIIVSNPPYISKEIAGEKIIHQLKYEPNEALFPVGPDPDIFYKKISEVGGDSLNEGGSCYLELNEFRAQQIEDSFKKLPWGQREVRIDLQGMPRMLKTVKE